MTASLAAPCSPTVNQSRRLRKNSQIKDYRSLEWDNVPDELLDSGERIRAGVGERKRQWLDRQ